MKKLLTVMFFALLMAGCGGDEKSGSDSSESNQPSAETIDLDDNETRKRIIAEAIDWKKLEWRGKEGEELFYAPNQQTPYTGWAKDMHDNGQIWRLYQHKDGKWDGLSRGWYSNGQKEYDHTYKDGKRITAVAWKPNGEKCPITKVVNGNGVRTWYNDNGTEDFRETIKDGEIVSRN